MELGEIINTDFPYATMADIDVLPPTGIGVRYQKIVTLSDDVSFVLVYNRWRVFFGHQNGIRRCLAGTFTPGNFVAAYVGLGLRPYSE